jgi:hypothetical protein
MQGVSNTSVIEFSFDRAQSKNESSFHSPPEKKIFRAEKFIAAKIAARIFTAISKSLSYPSSFHKNCVWLKRPVNEREHRTAKNFFCTHTLACVLLKSRKDTVP